MLMPSAALCGSALSWPREECCARPWLWVMLMGSVACGSPTSRDLVLDRSAGQWEGKTILIKASKCAAC